MRDCVSAHQPQLPIELVTMTTQGDRILGSLATAGGKGLFTKELEQALLEGRADIAVHSMKDVTVDLPEGLHIPVILQREDPRDALVSNTHASLETLPAGARVGTSSLRRQSQLRHRFPHLEVVELRGNVDTRLAKLDEGQFDAIVLAAAGLRRLGLGARIRAYLPIEVSLPAVGQGAIGVQCRVNDTRTHDLIEPLRHRPTQTCVVAERALNARLSGGCLVPIGAYAQLHDRELHVRGFVGAPDGSRVIYAEARAAAEDAEALGRAVAEDLLQQGAGAILQSVPNMRS